MAGNGIVRLGIKFSVIDQVIFSMLKFILARISVYVHSIHCPHFRILILLQYYCMVCVRVARIVLSFLIFFFHDCAENV